MLCKGLKIEKYKKYKMKNPFNPLRYGEVIVESTKKLLGLESLPQVSDSKVRSICTSVATVLGASAIAAGKYLQEKEITKQHEIDTAAQARSQESAQKHDLDMLRERNRHDLDKRFFSFPKESDSEMVLPEERYKTKDFSGIIDQPPIIE